MRLESWIGFASTFRTHRATTRCFNSSRTRQVVVEVAAAKCIGSLAYASPLSTRHEGHAQKTGGELQTCTAAQGGWELSMSTWARINACRQGIPCSSARGRRCDVNTGGEKASDSSAMLLSLPRASATRNGNSLNALSGDSTRNPSMHHLWPRG